MQLSRHSKLSRLSTFSVFFFCYHSIFRQRKTHQNTIMESVLTFVVILSTLTIYLRIWMNHLKLFHLAILSPSQRYIAAPLQYSAASIKVELGIGMHVFTMSMPTQTSWMGYWWKCIQCAETSTSQPVNYSKIW